jgi:hypothetical protein
MRPEYRRKDLGAGVRGKFFLVSKLQLGNAIFRRSSTSPPLIAGSSEAWRDNSLGCL